MIKAMNKLGIDGNFLNLKKDIAGKPCYRESFDVFTLKTEPK